MSEEVADLELVGRRIRGLLAKTVENGATEQEAMLASAKARELMDRYRLTLSDVQLQAEPIDKVTFSRPNRANLAAVDYCAKGIARYCGVKVWLTTEGKVRNITLFGLRGDVEMARYLYDMLAAVIKAETDLFREREHEERIRKLMEDMDGPVARSRDKRRASTSFEIGMATRINQRLIQMAIDLEPVAKTSTGTALVLVKNAVVNEAYAKLGLRLQSSGGGMTARDAAAYMQGQKVGDKVNLGRPVEHSNTQRVR